MLAGSLRLHERDLLHLALQNQESVVVQIDAGQLEEIGDLRPVARLAIQIVLQRKQSRPENGSEEEGGQSRMRRNTFDWLDLVAVRVMTISELGTRE